MLQAAERIKAPGREVQVSDAEGKWQIWLDIPARANDSVFDGLAGTKGLGALRALGGGFSDKAVAKLKDLPDLELLVLISDQLTDKSLEPISKLKSLNKLDLNQARLTKVGLRRLSGLPKLRRLYLYRAVIPESDLDELKAFKHLSVLNLPDTVSESKLQEIRKALPGVRVS
jgi:hypothetical protein